MSGEGAGTVEGEGTPSHAEEAAGRKGGEARGGDGAEPDLGRPASWRTPRGAPEAVALPSDEAAVAVALEEAAAGRRAVLPVGRGTWLDGGPPPDRVDVVLSTARITGIRDYDPADLTATVGAGTTVRELDDVLAEHGQWLPVDAPGVAAGTLGALFATASEGPLAARYGRLRDLLLGLTLVTGDGRVLELGGRVVKNVAGFDLTKLAVGSWGTLGVVTRVSLRLYPRPRSRRVLVRTGERLEELLEQARAVVGSGVPFAAVSLLEERPDGQRRCELRVRLHGNDAAVEAEADLLDRLAGPFERIEPPRLVGAASQRRRSGTPADDEAGPPAPPDPDLRVRLRLPPSRMPELVSIAREIGRLEGGRNQLEVAPVRFEADPWEGTLRVVVPNLRMDGPWPERWALRLSDLRRTLELRSGGLTVEEGAAALLDRVSAHRRVEGAEAGLRRAIRDRFDPGRVLVPGRMDH